MFSNFEVSENSSFDLFPVTRLEFSPEPVKLQDVGFTISIARKLTESPTINRLVLLLLPFVATYVITYLRAVNLINSKAKGKAPPTSPYWVPVLGHLFSFSWSLFSLPEIARRSFPAGPLGVKMGSKTIYFITGADNIVKVWRAKFLQAREVNHFALDKIFGSSKEALWIYKNDDSGTFPEPHPNSNIPDQDRYYYHNRKTITGFFNSPALKTMAYHYQRMLFAEISKMDVGHNWEERPDFFAFIQQLVTGPAISALCGPRMLEKNPDFVKQFWQFDTDIFWFFKLLPRFMIPSAWDNRSKLLASVKEWHAHARASFQTSSIDPTGHDPFYGSPLLRKRQEVLSRIKGVDADALASQDLALIWAQNGNSVPAIFWMIVEMLRRQEACKIAMDEAHETLPAEEIRAGTTIDIDNLCKKPMLLSIYAETLRVYSSILVMRSPAHQDFDLGDWKLPQDSLLAIDGRAAHMDPDIWNSGTVSRHVRNVPVEDFCPHRFLKQPDEASNGPTSSLADDMPAEDQGADPASKKPHFSMDGLLGGWLPYGGGNRQCPGKNFAKQEMILSFSMIMSVFEIEFLDEDINGPIQPNLNYYGMGTFNPARKLPFRVRRR